MQQDHITLARIGRRAMKLATLAYAIYLFLGALGLIAWVIYLQIWAGLAHALFFLFCAALFSWGQWRAQEPPESSGHGTRTRTARGRKPDWSLRQWSLLIIGIGAGIAQAMILLQVVVYYDAGVAIGPGLILAFALPLAGAGVIVFFVDVIDRRGERRP